MASSSSPRRGNAPPPATSTNATTYRRSHLPPPSSQSSSLSLGPAINSASHIATTPLPVSAGATGGGFSSSSPLGLHNPQHSRSSRQFFSSPPSPKTLNSVTSASVSAPNITTPIVMQHPLQSTAGGAPRPTAAGVAGGNGGGVSGEPNSHERMWAEMQQKLEEVELSADHVFGSSHTKSLEGLRIAQVELAQAWMRSEEDELDNKHSEFGKKAFAGVTMSPPRAGGAGVMFEREEDMENDVLLARKRRMANDEHFNKVAMSVVDVTQKLENVAKAMAGVELESRSIWADSTESDGSSIR